MTKIFNIHQLISLILLSTVLSGCGGGGGGSTGSKNLGPVVTVNDPGIIEERSQTQLSVNASDPDGTIREIRWLQLSGPSINFTNGSDTINFIAPEVDVDTGFSFSISVVDNDGAITTADLSGTILNVIRVNNAPIATDTTLVVDIDTAIDFSLPATDPDGDVLIFTITVDTQNGLVETLDAVNNLYRYTPNFQSLVDDELSFEVTDGELTASAKVFFDLVDPNPAKALLLSEVSPSQYWDDNRWIELYNGTGKTINLANYSIKTDSISLIDYSNNGVKTFPLPEKMMPDKSYLVLQYRYAFNLWHSEIVHSEKLLIIGDNSLFNRPIWNSSGFVELLDNTQSQTIDFVRFGDNQQLPQTLGHWNSSVRIQVESNNLGKSFVRSVNSADSNTINDWYFVDQSTLATPNPIKE